MKKRYGNNALVGQSGGPTAAINASLAGVISEWLANNRENGILYGMANGITGILNERLYNLNEIFSENKEALEILKQTPAAALGSCRKKLPSLSEDESFFEKLFALFEKYGIGYFFYIGGNDSMDTVLKLSAYANENGIDIKVIGVPKTVDNDLPCTDHTPGFASAAKYIATVFAELRRDTSVYTQKAVTVVEVMGRDAGWLTASSVLANTAFTEGPDLIYLPERPFSFKKCFDDIEKCWEKHPDILIAVSEGVRLENGSYVSADSVKMDNFGHAALSGAASTIKERIKERFGCKVRSVEINTPQRAAAHISALNDINEAFSVGAHAVKEARCGKSGIMTAIIRSSNSPYTVEYGSFNVNDVANKVKAVPDEFINSEGNYITDQGVSYLRPLIIGEHNVIYSEGVPKHFIFPKI